MCVANTCQIGLTVVYEAEVRLFLLCIRFTSSGFSTLLTCVCVCVRIFCRYPGYHEPHAPYAVTKQYWHVIAARLAFVFVFQYIVYACTKFVAWLVPDRPKLLELKIKREEFLAKESLQQRGVDDIDDGDLAVVA